MATVLPEPFRRLRKCYCEDWSSLPFTTRIEVLHETAVLCKGGADEVARLTLHLGFDVFEFTLEVLWRLFESFSGSKREVVEIVSWLQILGYLGAAGVSPGQLRKVLRLFFRMPLLSIPLLRTLNIMAEGRCRRNVQGIANEPTSFFCLGGGRSGLAAAVPDSVKWPFSKGYLWCAWVRVARHNSGGSSLFVLRSSKGHVLSGSIRQSGELELKVATGQGPPHVVVASCEIHAGSWMFVCVQHSKKVFGSSEVRVHVNHRLMFSGSLPYPRFGTCNLAGLHSGGGLEGSLGPIAIFTEPLPQAHLSELADCQRMDPLRLCPKSIHEAKAGFLDKCFAYYHPAMVIRPFGACVPSLGGRAVDQPSGNDSYPLPSPERFPIHGLQPWDGSGGAGVADRQFNETELTSLNIKSPEKPRLGRQRSTSRRTSFVELLASNLPSYHLVPDSLGVSGIPLRVPVESSLCYSQPSFVDAVGNAGGPKILVGLVPLIRSCASLVPQFDPLSSLMKASLKAKESKQNPPFSAPASQRVEDEELEAFLFEYGTDEGLVLVFGLLANLLNHHTVNQRLAARDNLFHLLRFVLYRLHSAPVQLSHPDCITTVLNLAACAGPGELRVAVWRNLLVWLPLWGFSAASVQRMVLNYASSIARAQPTLFRRIGLMWLLDGLRLWRVPVVTDPPHLFPTSHSTLYFPMTPQAWKELLRDALKLVCIVAGVGEMVGAPAPSGVKADSKTKLIQGLVSIIADTSADEFLRAECTQFLSALIAWESTSRTSTGILNFTLQSSTPILTVYRAVAQKDGLGFILELITNSPSEKVGAAGLRALGVLLSSSYRLAMLKAAALPGNQSDSESGGDGDEVAAMTDRNPSIMGKIKSTTSKMFTKQKTLRRRSFTKRAGSTREEGELGIGTGLEIKGKTPSGTSVEALMESAEFDDGINGCGWGSRNGGDSSWDEFAMIGGMSKLLHALSKNTVRSATYTALIDICLSGSAVMAPMLDSLADATSTSSPQPSRDTIPKPKRSDSTRSAGRSRSGSFSDSAAGRGRVGSTFADDDDALVLDDLAIIRVPLVLELLLRLFPSMNIPLQQRLLQDVQLLSTTSEQNRAVIYSFIPAWPIHLFVATASILARGDFTSPTASTAEHSVLSDVNHSERGTTPGSLAPGNIPSLVSHCSNQSATPVFEMSKKVLITLLRDAICTERDGWQFVESLLSVRAMGESLITRAQAIPTDFGPASPPDGWGTALIRELLHELFYSLSRRPPPHDEVALANLLHTTLLIEAEVWGSEGVTVDPPGLAPSASLRGLSILSFETLFSLCSLVLQLWDRMIMEAPENNKMTLLSHCTLFPMSGCLFHCLLSLVQWQLVVGPRLCAVKGWSPTFMVSLSRARNLLKSLGLVSSEHESSGIPAAEDVFCFSSSGSADDITPESVDEGDQPSTQRKDFWISRSEVDFGPWLNHFVYGLRQFVEAMQPLTSVMEGPGCGESTAAVDMAISLAKDIARSHDRLASVAPKTPAPTPAAPASVSEPGPAPPSQAEGITETDAQPPTTHPEPSTAAEVEVETSSTAANGRGSSDQEAKVDTVEDSTQPLVPSSGPVTLFDAAWVRRTREQRKRCNIANSSALSSILIRTNAIWSVVVKSYACARDHATWKDLGIVGRRALKRLRSKEKTRYGNILDSMSYDHQQCKCLLYEYFKTHRQPWGMWSDSDVYRHAPEMLQPLNPNGLPRQLIWNDHAISHVVAAYRDPSGDANLSLNQSAISTPMGHTHLFDFDEAESVNSPASSSSNLQRPLQTPEGAAGAERSSPTARAEQLEGLSSPEHFPTPSSDGKGSPNSQDAEGPSPERNTSEPLHGETEGDKSLKSSEEEPTQGTGLFAQETDVGSTAQQGEPLNVSSEAKQEDAGEEQKEEEWITLGQQSRPEAEGRTVTRKDYRSGCGRPVSFHRAAPPLPSRAGGATAAEEEIDVVFGLPTCRSFGAVGYLRRGERVVSHCPAQIVNKAQLPVHGTLIITSRRLIFEPVNNPRPGGNGKGTEARRSSVDAVNGHHDPGLFQSSALGNAQKHRKKRSIHSDDVVIVKGTKAKHSAVKRRILGLQPHMRIGAEALSSQFSEQALAESTKDTSTPQSVVFSPVERLSTDVIPRLDSKPRGKSNSLEARSSPFKLNELRFKALTSRTVHSAARSSATGTSGSWEAPPATSPRGGFVGVRNRVRRARSVESRRTAQEDPPSIGASQQSSSGVRDGVVKPEVKRETESQQAEQTEEADVSANTPSGSEPVEPVGDSSAPNLRVSTTAAAPPAASALPPRPKQVNTALPPKPEQAKALRTQMRSVFSNRDAPAAPPPQGNLPRTPSMLVERQMNEFLDTMDSFGGWFGQNGQGKNESGAESKEDEVQFDSSSSETSDSEFDELTDADGDAESSGPESVPRVGQGLKARRGLPEERFKLQSSSDEEEEELSGESKGSGKGPLMNLWTPGRGMRGDSLIQPGASQASRTSTEMSDSYASDSGTDFDSEPSGSGTESETKPKIKVPKGRARVYWSKLRSALLSPPTKKEAEAKDFSPSPERSSHLYRNWGSSQEISVWDMDQQREIAMNVETTMELDSLRLAEGSASKSFRKDPTIVVNHQAPSPTRELTFRERARLFTSSSASHAERTRKAISSMMDCFSVRSWSLADLVGIEPRRYLLRPTALEFFFSNGSSALINFYTHYNSPWGVPNPHGSGVRSTDTVAAHKRLREAIVEVICSLSPAQLTHTPSLDTGVAITASSGFSKDTNSMTQRWVRREISNLEYLLWLNRAAGRSFNDITQYPVLPWILSDYRNSPLNLMNASSFRDLTKPVGALDLKRVAQIKENYKSLKDEGQLPFHYGSHYSTAGLICFYLLRLEPFTSMSVELQSGHFDVPDRLFSSIAECWEGCLHGMGDVKELIPEFFFLPEMLVNRSRLPLGDRQNCHGIVDDVELPAWAGDAFDFVWWHRRALETEHVSQQLHHWIDLVFGYKQRGAPAVAAVNSFHPLTYENSVNWDEIRDPRERQAKEAQIDHFGQTPQQLFDTPHPQRMKTDACLQPFLRMDRLPLVSIPPSQVQSGSLRGQILPILPRRNLWRRSARAPRKEKTVHPLGSGDGSAREIVDEDSSAAPPMGGIIDLGIAVYETGSDKAVAKAIERKPLISLDYCAGRMVGVTASGGVRVFSWSPMTDSKGLPFRLKPEKPMKLASSRWFLPNSGVQWGPIAAVGGGFEHYLRAVAESEGATGEADLRAWSSSPNTHVSSMGGVGGEASNISRVPSVSILMKFNTKSSRSIAESLIVSCGYVDGSIQWQSLDTAKSDVMLPQDFGLQPCTMVRVAENIAVSCHMDGAVALWRLGTGAVLKSFLHSEEDRRFHAIHGRQYGSDGESMEATALGPATGVDWLLVDHLPPSSAAVTSLEIDFHRGLVYIGSMDGTICAVDFNERCARRLIGLPDTYFSFHNGLFESRVPIHMAITSSANLLVHYRMRERPKVGTVGVPGASPTPSSKQQELIEFSRIVLYNVNGTCLSVSRRLTSCITAMIVSEDGEWLVTGDADGLIAFWSTYDLTCVQVLSTMGHGKVTSFTFIDNGVYLAAGCEDGEILVVAEPEVCQKQLEQSIKGVVLGLANL